MSTIGRFDFSLNAPGPTDGLPVDPFVVLNLKHWDDRLGSPAVSAHLASIREIDEHVRNLVEDIRAAGERAKRALRGARGYIDDR